MGLKARNLDEQIIELVVGGDQAAATDLAADYAEFAGWIKNIYAKMGVAGVTGNHDTDLNVNGTSILVSTKIRFATGVTTATYPALTSQSVAKGDRFSIDNDAIQTTPAKGQVIQIVISKRSPGAVRNLAPSAQV